VLVIRYIINGLVATAVHFSVLTFNLEVAGMKSAGIANLIAAVFGISTSFLGSRYFVFRVAYLSIGRQLLSFGFLYALLAVAHGTILFLWSDVGKLDYRAGFVVATCFQVAATYVGNKNWVFRA
jgi:putative flippase GtrA